MQEVQKHSRHEYQTIYFKKEKNGRADLIERRHTNYIMIREIVHVDKGWLLKYTTRTHYSV